MFREVIFAAAAIASFSNSANAQERSEPITVGMSGSYFPFTFVQQGKLQGFEVDLLKAIGEELGRKIEFETISFPGLIGALEAGRIDTVANQITITPEREKAFVFSVPYVIDGAQIVTRKGNEAAISGPADLSGKSVAVSLGSNFEDLLRRLPNADEIDIRAYESNIEQDTALGRVDAFVGDRMSAAQVIRKGPLPLALAGRPFSEIHNAYPFRDDEEGRALRDEVNAALKALRESGKLTEISFKWFESDITGSE